MFARGVLKSRTAIGQTMKGASISHVAALDDTHYSAYSLRLLIPNHSLPLTAPSAVSVGEKG